ncbi:hypothetical protein [Thiohalophilus sp.]|uniref:hypothetical protein n=1 Tax=Thiohalophilus sp. TaxID=3028392 RepID=UPI002ACE2136|nr:hypothetical protein [Thiohalophilus sp.]MDZ7805268.1 hypothetical protein [Thiohalophilus sp.]
MNKLGKLLLACLLCLGLVVGLVWLVQPLTQAAMTRPEYRVLESTRPTTRPQLSPPERAAGYGQDNNRQQALLTAMFLQKAVF